MTTERSEGGTEIPGSSGRPEAGPERYILEEPIFGFVLERPRPRGDRQWVRIFKSRAAADTWLRRARAKGALLHCAAWGSQRLSSVRRVSARWKSKP